jgi:3-phosphoshikimate 1-carboxyvinyltransferase
MSPSSPQPEPAGAGAALRGPLADLPDPLAIPVLPGAFEASVRPPGSKSLTNRALLLASLASGTSTLRGALVGADDASVMIAALRRLGAKIDADDADPTTLRVTGVGGRWALASGEDAALDLHNSGTATRFLAGAALVAPAGSSVTIDGSARMRERPIGELVDAMRTLGARVEYLGVEGFVPLRIYGLAGTPDGVAGVTGAGRAGAPKRGSPVTLRFGRTLSGQFISAMLMVAPLLERPVRIEFVGEPTSGAYIDMTAALLTRVGFDRGAPGAPPRAFELAVEPDASGATYFWGAAAIVPGARCTVAGLPPMGQSLQGDAGFAGALAAFGANVVSLKAGTTVAGPPLLRAAEIDLSDMPDTAMTAAVVALFAAPTPDNPGATTTLRGLATLRVKETDRLAALRAELTKVGATVEIVAERGDESLRITPAPDMTGPPGRPVSSFPRVEFETYADHRMAMALALVGLRRPNVWIRDPGCVAKTYPGYFADLAGLYP